MGQSSHNTAAAPPITRAPPGLLATSSRIPSPLRERLLLIYNACPKARTAAQCVVVTIPYHHHDERMAGPDLLFVRGSIIIFCLGSGVNLISCA